MIVLPMPQWLSILTVIVLSFSLLFGLSVAVAKLIKHIKGEDPFFNDDCMTDESYNQQFNKSDRFKI